MSTSKFVTCSAQINQSDARVDSYGGRPHVVAPVVAVRESVLKGYLLPSEEIAAASQGFNGVPLPVGHPQEGGEFVTANTPSRLDRQSVGRFFDANSSGDGALRGEIWVDAEKSASLAQQNPVMGAPLARLARHLDDPGNAGEFIDALPEESHAITANADDGDSLLEVSTAYWFDEDPQRGVFEGNEYAAVQRNLKPDHLALLPHKKGECSVADGCGAPRANHATVANGRDSSATDDVSMTNTIRLAANAIGRFAHNCVCGCGGSCHSVMEPQELSDLTGISLQVCEEMSDEDREALASLAQHNDEEAEAGAGTDDSGEQTTDTTETDDSGDDAVLSAIESLSGELADVKSELNDVRENVAAQEQEERAALIDAIETHSSLTRDHLEGLDTPVLEGMHADLTPRRADFGGRVSGIPAGNTNGQDDERLEEARKLAAQLKGTPTGTTEDGE